MAKQWTQFLPINASQMLECERLSGASGSGWWRLQKSDIPSFVPESMRSKLDGGVMVLSGSASGATFLMYGAERVDKPNVDIQPFGLIVRQSGASTGMALIHHGRWQDRTITLPADFAKIASDCSTASYFFARPPEGKTSGTLDELSLGQEGAFNAIISSLSSQPGGSYN